MLSAGVSKAFKNKAFLFYFLTGIYIVNSLFLKARRISYKI